MTVYVDDFATPATVGSIKARWSHLIADTPEELHAFAARLGLRRAWFQDPTVNGKPKAAPGTRAAENWHYDVTENKRRQAIRLGAVPVPWREIPDIIDARYTQKTAPPSNNPTDEKETTVTTAPANLDDDTELWEPSETLVKEFADYVTTTYGASARLAEIALLMDTLADTDDLDDGQQEILAEAVRDELAARDNGRRR